MTSSFGSFFQALYDLFVGEMFGTNFTMIVACLLLTAVLLKLLVSTVKFHRSFESKMNKDDEIEINRLQEDTISKQDEVTVLTSEIDEYQQKLSIRRTAGSTRENDKDDGHETSPLEGPAGDEEEEESRQPIQRVIREMEEYEKKLRELYKKVDRAESNIAYNARMIECIGEKPVDRVDHVTSQLSKLRRMKKAVMIAGFLAMLSTIFSLLAYGTFSPSFTRVSGVSFMIAFTMIVNLNGLLVDLRDVLVTGNPERSEFTKAENVERQLYKDERGKPITRTVISKKTYLEIVKYKQKSFYNLKKNAIMIVTIGAMYVIPFVIMDHDEYARLIDIGLLFIVSQFASVSLFKYYINSDAFKERIKFAFLKFLKDGVKNYYDNGTNMEKSNYIDLILMYLSFHFKNEVNRDFSNKVIVRRNIVKKYILVDDPDRVTFQEFLRQLLYYTPHEITGIVDAIEDEKKIDPIRIIKILATIVSFVYTIMQVLKFVSIPID